MQMLKGWCETSFFKSGYLSVQGPFFGTRLEFFLQDVHENIVPPDPPWYGTSWQVLLELTFSDVVTAGGQWLRPDGKKCFAPLPRTVYLVMP